VELSLASSFISAERALRNLKGVGTRGFDEVCAAAKEAWRTVLSHVEVESDDIDRLRTFYSCLSRSTLFPHKFYEIGADGAPVHYSPFNGEVRPGFLYTDSGFWDVFRAQLPLLDLLYPSTSREIQEGLACIAEENEFLPEWASPGHRGCMVGNNSASIIAGTYLKGLGTERIDTLYQTLVYATEHVHPTASSSGRLGHEYYNSLGYIPYDVGINENVARTLEYAYDDWCLLQLARRLGRPQEELDKWAARAMNYKNVFDPAVCLMRGRNADGSFQEPFSPYKWGDAYTEGNAWHYTWSVFHDPQGLIDLMGGPDSFVQMLDSVWVVPPIYDDSYYGVRIHEITEMQVADMGNYAHGNQPAQHMVYLYDWAGQPWKTQLHARQVMDKLYRCTPDGYCGDEDNGQTSAWYILSALGFYSVCPAADEYAIGSPLFEKAVVHLENGRDIVITARGNDPDHVYIASAKLNGRTWTRNYLKYEDLLKGARITYKMSDKPVKTRGTAPEDAPYSFSRE
jgi:predicted alpha-1,2-mannosidase